MNIWFLTWCTRRHVRGPRRTPIPTVASLCPTCSALSITDILRDGLPRENMIPLGSLEGILRRDDQCRFCHLVASLFRRRWCLDTLPNVDLSDVQCSLSATSVGALADPRLEERKRCHRLHIHVSDRPPEVVDALARGRMDLTLDIQLLEADAHKVLRARELHGRRMADTVDMELLKTWIGLCEREHGDACGRVWWRAEVDLPPFVRMVDVTQMSLVRVPSNCRYVALSYVWGTAGNSYWTTTANVDSRAQPAGLDPSVLPGTILDSIRVTQALGEQYLWIDALCIIQDSPDDKIDQIGVMELIYSCATLTIVAAGGESAHARLPGASAGSRPLHQHIEVIQDFHLAIPLPSLGEAIAQTVWYTRGWTFQEMLLSRRRLFFTEHQAYFECKKDIWCEDFVAESKTLPYSSHPTRYSGSGGGLLFLPKKHPSPKRDYLTTYSDVVERYTQRRLTYPSDVLHAITALTNAMTRAYGLAGGNAVHAFRYGMQIWNLNHSLLWQPKLDSVHARRLCIDTGISMWPSWAWAGWTGTACYSGLSQLTTTANSTSSQGSPAESLVTDWCIVDDDLKLIRLEVEKISFSGIVDRPSGCITRTRYPIREGTIDEQLIQPLPSAGTLVFRTQCASFKIERLGDTSRDAKAFPHTIFRILSDVRRPSSAIGRMILPSSIPSSTTLEFIVLSRSRRMTGLYEESVYGDSYDGCLLNVMAVRGAGHDTRVKERVGLGVIFEQAWLECGAEVEMVLLG